jgi:hypothetical protein
VIALLLSLAVVLILLSLPFPKAKASSALRRTAGLLLLLAFAPFVLLAIYHSLSECATANGGPVATVAAFVLISLIAYGALKARRFLTRPTGPMGPARRRSPTGKRLVIDEPRRNADPDPWNDFLT